MNDSRTNSDDVEFTFDHQVRLVDELKSVLTDQLQLARQGNSTNKQFGVLTSKASALVKEIERTGILDRNELRYRRETLRKRYENLCLIVAAQKANVCRELSRIRKGKKTISVYRTNTSSNTDRVL